MMEEKYIFMLSQTSSVIFVVTPELMGPPWLGEAGQAARLNDDGWVGGRAKISAVASQPLQPCRTLPLLLRHPLPVRQGPGIN